MMAFLSGVHGGDYHLSFVCPDGSYANAVPYRMSIHFAREIIACCAIFISFIPKRLISSFQGP